jgi:hypothetical protein
MPQKENEGAKEDSYRRSYPGCCSFCRKHYREVGPLVEGPDSVFICRQCVQACMKIIEDECGRLGVPLPQIGEGGYRPISLPVTIIKRIAMSQREDDRGEIGLFPRYPGWCSFCRWNYRQAGPLAEGPDQVCVCYRCMQLCVQIQD